MKTFTDSAGRTWTLAVTVGVVKRVRDLAGVDLIEAATGDLWERLLEDPVLLVDTLYALVKPEADAGGVSDEEFGRALVGDALDGALAALEEELLAFFPRHQRVRAAANLLAAAEKAEARAKEARATLGPTPACPAARPGGSSGTSPGSADATPDP
jgi:hypothetical protein